MPTVNGRLFVARLVAHGVEQFVAESKDLFGVAEDASAAVGEFQATPDAAEQGHPEAFLQLAQLAADRLRREMQLFAGAGDGAGFGDAQK
jgi:hypothetical protein